MMQFYMGDTILIGITKENMNRLTTGKPIRFDVKGKEPIKTVAIIYGEDKPAILKELENAGMQVPHWMWDSARKEPL